MKTIKTPVRVAVIGMGGWAGQHHRCISILEKEGLCKLVAVSGRNPAQYANKMLDWKLEERGVKVFTDYRKLVAECRDELDCLCIPTPIQTHAEMHKLAVDNGLACFLEKPPTLYHQELDEMLAVEERAQFATEIPFMHIVEDSRRMLKNRILNNDFGPLKKAVFMGLWPRGPEYYTRNAWGGRLMVDGEFVVDGSLGNAMAHFVHDTLFWCGPKKLYTWALPVKVEAEMYRSRDIEGADTAFIKAVCEDGVEIAIVSSHGCEHEFLDEKLELELATVENRIADRFEVKWRPGVTWKGIQRRDEYSQSDFRDTLTAIFRNYFEYLAGEGGRPYTRLIDSKPFVYFHDLAYVAANTIHTIPPEYVKEIPKQHGSVVAIQGIEAVAERFVKEGLFPSQQGCPWGKAGGSATLADLPKFAEVIRRQCTKQ